MALALAEAGAQIALVSRDQAKLESVAAEIRERGGKSEVFRADVSNESDVRALESEVSNRFGKIQILINNAGVNVRKPITEFTLDEWNYRSRYESHGSLSDVPRIRTAHEGDRLR